MAAIRRKDERYSGQKYRYLNIQLKTLAFVFAQKQKPPPTTITYFEPVAVPPHLKIQQKTLAFAFAQKLPPTTITYFEPVAVPPH